MDGSDRCLKSKPVDAFNGERHAIDAIYVSILDSDGLCCLCGCFCLRHGDSLRQRYWLIEVVVDERRAPFAVQIGSARKCVLQASQRSVT